MNKAFKLLGLLFVGHISFAQLDLSTVLEGGVDDAQVFLENYIEPATAGFGYGLNGGWYNTAKTHKRFGVDISVISSASLIPTNKEFFTFNNADYTNIKLTDNSVSSASIPTLLGTFSGAGAENNRPLLNFTFNEGNDDISISAPPGLGLKEDIGYNIIPTATIQAGIGLFKHTDVKFRYIPKISAQDAELSTFGIGLMHDIKHWLPFINKLPIDMSALIAWTNVNSKVSLNPTDEPTQAVEFDTNSLTFQLVASKKLSILTIYGGIGTSSFNSEVSLLGNYKTESKTYTDPINLNFKGQSLRSNVGVRLKLLIFTFSADYAFQEYNTFTAGFGFSIR